MLGITERPLSFHTERRQNEEVRRPITRSTIVVSATKFSNSGGSVTLAEAEAAEILIIEKLTFRNAFNASANLRVYLIPSGDSLVFDDNGVVVEAVAAEAAISITDVEGLALNPGDKLAALTTTPSADFIAFARLTRVVGGSEN